MILHSWALELGHTSLFIQKIVVSSLTCLQVKSMYYFYFYFSNSCDFVVKSRSDGVIMLAARVEVDSGTFKLNLSLVNNASI